jgi:hypothetical protein
MGLTVVRSIADLLRNDAALASVSVSHVSLDSGFATKHSVMPWAAAFRCLTGEG